MRLLLCDDEKMLSHVLSVLLKKNNYSVDCAYDGEEALDYILTGAYDAIILDVMMPKRDGFSVLKEIRSHNINTPVIMLTAKSQLDDKLEGPDNGADDYLTKPFASAELLARLRTLIRRGQDKETANYNFEGLSLNPLTFRLSYNGSEEALSSKEYQIMEALILHPHNIISQDTLLEKVYGFDDGDITTLWVYISYLRKKLKALNSNITIKSVRNAGYTLGVCHD